MEPRNLPGELWRDVPGADGYAVSNLGRTSGPRGLLRDQPTGRGYRKVSVTGRRQAKVHTLVLEAFVGPCPEGMEAAHDNGVRDDNRLANLAWKTRLDNAADRYRHGTVPHVLSEDVIEDIRRARAAGERNRDTAARLGLSRQTVSAVALGQRRRLPIAERLAS